MLEQKDLKLENRWEKLKNRKVNTPRVFRYRIFLYFQYLWKNGWLRKENKDVIRFRFGRFIRLALRDVNSARYYIGLFGHFWFIFLFLWESLFLLRVSRIWIVGPYSVYNPKQKYNKSVFLNNRYEFIGGNFFVYIKKIRKDDEEELAWKKLELKFGNRIHRIENKRFFVKISKKQL